MHTYPLPLSLLLGDHFVSKQFNIITVIIVSILARNPKKRHVAFHWLITILASGLVIYGTSQRILQIHGRDEGWHDNAKLSQSEVEHYFTQSLMSWIACIIMDGTQAYNIYQAHKGNLRQLLQDFGRRWTVMQAVETVGLLTSCLSMLKFGVDVYDNFHHLTHDVSVHMWFFLAVGFKVGRIIIQGT